jgi:hypothetical protein
MDEPRTPDHRGATVTPPGPPGCVFCGQPVAAAERCPLLPSSHWTCCACEAPEAAGTDAA